MSSEKRVLIVGLGLLGGSYAMGLTQKGWQVDAIDLDEYAIAYAKERGIIQNGATENFEEMIRSADRMIFALYPAAFVSWVEQYRHLFRKGLIFTDVSGVKCGIVQPIQAMLPDGVEFIPSHPMAGREVSGVQNANTEMFRPANFIITPTDKNTAAGLAFAQVVAEDLGFAHICRLTVEEHDRMIGYVSQLTHAIAVSLMCASDRTDLAEYTGDSFRDLTRIARINDVMWSELFLENREILINEIDAFADTLQKLKQHLHQQDRESLKQMFRTSTARRAAFDKKR